MSLLTMFFSNKARTNLLLRALETAMAAPHAVEEDCKMWAKLRNDLLSIIE